MKANKSSAHRPASPPQHRSPGSPASPASTRHTVILCPNGGFQTIRPTAPPSYLPPPTSLAMPASLSHRVRPWAAMLGLAGLIVAAIVLRPQWQAYRRAAFVEQLAAAARQADDDRRLRRLVEQLGELTPDSIEALAELAASPRAAAAQPAQQAINLLVGRWEVRTERTLTDAEGRAMLRLAEAFADEIDRYGPVGRGWVEAILLTLVDESEQMTPHRAASLLGACERALSRLPTPTVVPRVLPVTPLPAPTTVALPKASVDVVRLSETAAGMAPVGAAPAQSPPGLDPFENPKTEDAASVGRSPITPTPLTWQGRATAQPLPGSRSTASGESDLSAPAETFDEIDVETTVPPEVAIDIPSPQLVRSMAREYRRMSTDALVDLATTTSRYLRWIVVDELQARRVARGGQPARDVSAPTPIDPEHRIRSAQQLPAGEARVVLRRLVQDADPEVRLEALTAIATTADPQLEEIAQQRAATDPDARVVRLASEILQRKAR